MSFSGPKKVQIRRNSFKLLSQGTRLDGLLACLQQVARGQ